MTEKSANEFDLDKMNQALYMTLVDAESADVCDTSFNIIAATTQRHLSWDETNFGELSKGAVLGLIIDDMSDKILSTTS